MGTIPTLEDCKPGLTPVEFNVLIAPEKAEEKTKGGIILTDAVKETNELASQKGRLVAISPLAFTYETWPEGARLPLVGDLVWFGKYAGTLVTGEDGVEYRMCKDKDIGAIVLP